MGGILQKNQMDKVQRKQSLIEEKQTLSNALSLDQNENKKQRKRHSQFIYNLYEEQCTKQRDEYKQQLDFMKVEYKKFMDDFKKLRQKNVALMIENESLHKLKSENKKLK